MILRKTSELSSTAVELSTHEPLVLGGDTTVRVIESGSVGLYAAEVTDGVQVGPRRLLQRLGAGQAFFSAPRAPTERFGLLVVPIRRATVAELPLASFASSARPSLRSVGAIEAWVELSSGLAGTRELPKLCTRAEEDGELVLQAGEALCAQRTMVVWAQVLEGIACFSDLAHVSLAPGSAPLPLTSATFLRATETTRIRVRTTTPDPVDLEGGLAALQSIVLRQVAAEAAEEGARAMERLRARADIQAQRTNDALVSLASVFDSSEAPVRSDTPLMTAITAVGRALGVEMRHPGRSEVEGRSDPIDAIARASRVRLRWVSLTGEWWKRDCGPLLAFRDEDGVQRPIALLPDRSAKYAAFDPIDGSRVPIDAALAGRLAPEAVSFYRPLHSGRLRLADLFRFSTIRRLPDLAVALGAGVVATLLGMVAPQTTALLMDYAIPDADQQFLLELGLGLAATVLGSALFQLAQALALVRVGVASESEGQAAVWDRLLRLRPTFFREFTTGDIQSRVGAVSQIGQQLSGATLTAIFSGYMAILNLGLLYYYDPKLSFVAVGVGLVVMAFTLGVGFLVRRRLRVLLQLGGDFFGLVVQLISAVGKLRVAGAEERAFVHWVKQYTEQLRLRDGVQRLNDVSAMFNLMLGPASSVVLFLLAHEMLLESSAPGGAGGFSLGTFLAFYTAFGTFLGGISALSSTAVGVQDALVQGKRIEPILEAVPEIDETASDPGRLEGRLEVESVSFGYDADVRVLDDLSLRAEPGEFIAIVGPSGSGKSTLLRLLLGFEKPDTGLVSYDGRDLASLDVVAVRRQLGVVLQSGRVESGSIFDIIACGNILSLDEAWAAAEAAGLADDVRQMPMGMHTMIGSGGGNLSGGQRQRLLIARALGRQPRLLLFDEATSALDNRTQAIVSESLERLKVTRLVVAHRMSTIRRADRIYVLDRGKQVQEGSFDELMAEPDGLFARMMARQLA